MNTQNNVSLFADALHSALDASNNAEAKGAALVVAMVSSVGEFTLSDCQAYFKAPNKAEVLRNKLVELSPKFVHYLNESRLDYKNAPEKERSKQADRQEYGKKMVRRMELLLRDAYLSVYYLRDVNAEQIKLTKEGKLSYLIATINEETGALDETVKERVTQAPANIRKNANERLAKAGLKASAKVAPQTDEQKAKTKQLVASISTETGFVELCKMMTTLIKAKNRDEMSESEEQAITDLEESVIEFAYSFEGKVDAQMLYETYAVNVTEKKAAA